MGTRKRHFCSQCDYEAMVSGGDDVGMLAATSTIHCYDCEKILDVVTAEEPWLAMDDWQECTRSSRGVVARRYPMNMQMGLGHDGLNENLGAWASDFRFNESNHRAFYRRWAQLMAPDD